MNKKQLEKMLRLANISKKPMNEGRKNTAIELIKSVADGNTYAIVRENRTYFLMKTETKSTLTENDFDYIGGLSNRTKNSFRAYDDAVSRLNIMFNDINRTHGITESVNMVDFDYTLNENGEYQSLDEKKFILKQPKPKMKTPEPEMDFGSSDTEGGNDEFDFGGDTEDTSSEDEFDFGDESGDTEGGNDEFDFGDESGDTEGGDELDFGDEGMDSEGGDEEMDFGTEEGSDFGGDTEGGDTIKDIQRTTGKLGQQLRDTEDLSSDMQKWVAKSVMSALKLDKIDSEDKQDIINSIENTGNTENQEEEVDFMDDYYEQDRAGDIDLEDDEEFLLDDEGPGGYLGDDYDMVKPDLGNNKPASKDPRTKYYSQRTPQQRSNYLVKKQADSDMLNYYGSNSKLADDGGLGFDTELPITYMSDTDLDEGPGGYLGFEEDPMEEGMSSWSKPDAEGGMGWETNEEVSYMDEMDPLLDNLDISDDIYGMNNPAEKPSTRPTTTPGTRPERPVRPSKSPFTPPSRIRPGEEPRPKAGSRRQVDYMDDERRMNAPSPTKRPSERPTTTPGTRPERPVRPSKSPFTPPSRIRPGEEPRPKARRDGGIDYMDDDVTFE